MNRPPIEKRDGARDRENAKDKANAVFTSEGEDRGRLRLLYPGPDVDWAVAIELTTYPTRYEGPLRLQFLGAIEAWNQHNPEDRHYSEELFLLLSWGCDLVDFWVRRDDLLKPLERIDTPYGERALFWIDSTPGGRVRLEHVETGLVGYDLHLSISTVTLNAIRRMGKSPKWVPDPSLLSEEHKNLLGSSEPEKLAPQVFAACQAARKWPKTAKEAFRLADLDRTDRTMFRTWDIVKAARKTFPVLGEYWSGVFSAWRIREAKARKKKR